MCGEIAAHQWLMYDGKWFPVGVPVHLDFCRTSCVTMLSESYSFIF